MIGDTTNMNMLGYFCDAVKADANGRVSGYLVRYGTPNATDLEGDYFTKSTDYGFPLDAPVPINLYYHHGMDKQVGKRAIGKGIITPDATGLWYEAQLNMADEYAVMVANLGKAGKLGYSSGAAGHLVERKRVGAANEVTRWPIAEASLTPTPAEPQNMVKSIDALLTGKGMYMEDDAEVEYEPVAPTGTPTDWAMQVYNDAAHYTFHEGIENLYEIMCAAFMQTSNLPGDTVGYVVAVIDEFANRAKVLATNAPVNSLVKSLEAIRPDTVRQTERALRDVVGLSRTKAKQLAPVVHDALWDAGDDVCAEVVEQTTKTTAGEVTPADDTNTRELLKAKLTVMKMAGQNDN